MVQHPHPGQERTMAQALADAAAAANQQSGSQQAGPPRSSTASSATIIPNSQILPSPSGPSQPPPSFPQPPPGAQPPQVVEHTTPEALEALRRQNEAEQIAYDMEARERR
ncbi:hypothetical protein BDW02DRAFT_121800, partial [Decorospora gaudefroyi]